MLCVWECVQVSVEVCVWCARVSVCVCVWMCVWVSVCGVSVCVWVSVCGVSVCVDWMAGLLSYLIRYEGCNSPRAIQSNLHSDN